MLGVVFVTLEAQGNSIVELLGKPKDVQRDLDDSIQGQPHETFVPLHDLKSCKGTNVS